MMGAAKKHIGQVRPAFRKKTQGPVSTISKTSINWGHFVIFLNIITAQPTKISQQVTVRSLNVLAIYLHEILVSNDQAV